MTITILILLLVIAIGLILVEIFLIPGVGIPGIAGAVLMVIALVLAYQISMQVGNASLLITGILSFGLLGLSLRAKTWDRLSQKEEIKSKVELRINDLKVGDKGKAVSRLSPMGKVMIHNQFFEATSRGNYISENTDIEIINIEGNKIIVEST